MANPVQRLISILKEWEASGETPWTVRQADENTPNFWHPYGDLIALMQVAEACADRAGLLDEFGVVLAKVWNTLVLPRSNWIDTKTIETSITGSDYAALQALAVLANSQGSMSPFTSQDTDAIRESLDEIRHVIWTIDDITEEFKGYIDDLITECIDILDGENPDPDLARTLAFQVIGATASVSDVMTEEQQKKVLPWIKRLSTALTSGFASGTGSRLAQHVVDTGIGMILGITAGE